MAQYDDDLENEVFDNETDISAEDLSENDDFSSELDSEEDVWEDEQGMGSEGGDQDTSPKKKKSSLITFLIIGVVVLAGLGFVFLKFSGGGTSEQVASEQPAEQDPNSLANLRDQATPQEQKQLVEATDGVVSPSPETAPAEPQGFMNAESGSEPSPEAAPALPESPTMTAVEAPPAAVPPIEALPAPVAETSTASEPAPVVLAAPEAVSDFPSVDQIKKAPSLEESAPAPVPEAVPESAPIASVPEEAKQAAETEAKLNEAQSKIATLEKELAAAQEKIVAVTETSEVSKDARVQDLEAKIAALEKKLAARESESATPRSKEPPVSGQVAETVRKAPVRAVQATPKAATVKSSSWELRSAQPGQALLARKGNEDLRTVNVGDTLPGLGRILSIDQSSAGWVVKGTLAKVTQ